MMGRPKVKFRLDFLLVDLDLCGREEAEQERKQKRLRNLLDGLLKLLRVVELFVGLEWSEVEVEVWVLLVRWWVRWWW